MASGRDIPWTLQAAKVAFCRTRWSLSTGGVAPVTRKRLRTMIFLSYAKIKFVQSRAARVLLCPRRAAHM